MPGIAGHCVNRPAAELHLANLNARPLAKGHSRNLGCREGSLGAAAAEDPKKSVGASLAQRSCCSFGRIAVHSGIFFFFFSNRREDRIEEKQEKIMMIKIKTSEIKPVRGLLWGWLYVVTQFPASEATLLLLASIA